MFYGMWAAVGKPTGNCKRFDMWRAERLIENDGRFPTHCTFKAWDRKRMKRVLPS